jgi:hypothetical protein
MDILRLAATFDWLKCYQGLPQGHRLSAYFNSSSNWRERFNRALTAWRCLIIVRVWSPVVSALQFPLGAPEPAAPPCIRHRFLP